MSIRPALSAALQAHGLHLRGGFCPQAHEAITLPDGRHAAVLWLAGNVGGSMWAHFQSSPLAQDGLPDPLDRWSRHIGQALAQQFGGLALYPFDGPPLHGLWHAYRFALALPTVDADDRAACSQRMDAAPLDENPCLRCAEQPCLQACPVQAYDGQQFAIEHCRDHVRHDAQQQCLSGGCLARNACPVAPHLRYAPAQAHFHMQAFLRGAGA